MMYLLGFGLAFAVTAVATPLIRRLALKWGILDRPLSEARKQHSRPVAYLGGIAIFLGFIIAIAVLVPASRHLAALLSGCFILVVVGAVDDAKRLSPWHKLLWQIFAAFIALGGGIGITTLTNPFGGVINLSYGRFAVHLFNYHFHIAPIANSLSILWMVGVANTVNFLDGLDGLACGVSGIAAFVMFLLAVGPHVKQPGVALLAIILAGAAFGFLPFNFFPARIFMGDSGAYFLGLTLAMLAVYSGAKLATAALVLGLPIIDAIFVAIRRLAKGKSPFRADRQHFHYLLVEAGLSQRQAVMIFYGTSLAFGLSALIASTTFKLVSFGFLAALVIGSVFLLGRHKGPIHV